MNWFEITLIDGTRGLLNLDNVVDIWKGLDDMIMQLLAKSMMKN